MKQEQFDYYLKLATALGKAVNELNQALALENAQTKSGRAGSHSELIGERLNNVGFLVEDARGHLKALKEKKL